MMELDPVEFRRNVELFKAYMLEVLREAQSQPIEAFRVVEPNPMQCADVGRDHISNRNASIAPRTA